MRRVVLRFTLLLFCVCACCARVPAQQGNTVTLRLLDGKTGTLIATSNFLVRVNHETEVHGNWVKQSEDGTGTLSLPGYAKEISIHATYESAMSTYVNCDSDKEHATAEHAAGADRWYSVQTILTSGIVAPNNCAGKKIPERLQVVAKPGEFVFFVRPMNAREQMKD